MLRNRTKAATTKQSLMADQTPLVSLTKNPSTPTSSFLNSPRFFNGFLTKNNLADAETTSVSPTSILDTKNSSSLLNPFSYERSLPNFQTPFPEIINSCDKSEPEAIGLALVDSFNQEKGDGNFFGPINRMALFGSKLKVQIPATDPSCSIYSMESPKSPADFGIKNRKSQLSSLSSDAPAKDFTRQLSLKEMELSEDYTCVITRGPNPKTTHIFDDHVIQSCSREEDIKTSDGNNMECGFEANLST